MKKIISTLSLFSILLTLTACPPYSKSNDQSNTNSVNNLEAILSKTSTGNESVSYLNQLRGQGFKINYLLKSSAEVNSLNGHNGGGFERRGAEINIFINNSLSEKEQAHVVAHELVHIKDDFETDLFLKEHSYVGSAAQNFIANYKYSSADNFDPNVVSYVLGTLFCTEARAYSKNQELNDQGLETSLFAKGNNLPQFIDQNYIYNKFNVSYGGSAQGMQSWCLSFGSITDIQNQLSW